jgi:hypothetical protein
LVRGSIRKPSGVEIKQGFPQAVCRLRDFRNGVLELLVQIFCEGLAKREE